MLWKTRLLSRTLLKSPPALSVNTSLEEVVDSATRASSPTMRLNEFAAKEEMSEFEDTELWMFREQALCRN
jgi:hypothetical protein